MPLFRVYSRQVETPERPRPERHLAGWAGGVHWAKAEGRLRDPSATRFLPWPNPLSKAELLYSWFQLLALQQLGPWVGHFKGRRVGDGVEWELPPADNMAVAKARGTRSLAIILEVLSPRYRPRVVNSFSVSFPEDSAEMGRHIWSPPSSTSSEQVLLSGIEPDTFLGQAESLLTQARFFDPMGDWHQVVRTGAPNRWSDLKFDALQAMDWRIAAEMLLLFYIEKALATHRKHKDNIDKVWNNWEWQPSKVKLAKETWPILLRNLADQDHMEIPIGRTIQTIVDLVGPTKRATHMRTNDTT